MCHRHGRFRAAALVLLLTLVTVPAAPAAAQGAGTAGPLAPADAAEPLPLTAELPAEPVTGEPLPVMADAPDPGEITAPAAIVMDVLTGQVVYERNADEPRPPASITKVMTMLLTYEAVAAGQASWDDEVVISQRAQSMGGTQAFLAAGQTFPLFDLLKAVAVASANDAAVAIAEHLAGSVEAFAERMNARARELGMRTAHFANPHGLDEPGHALSARDVAVVSRELVRRFPEVLDLTSIWTYTFQVSDNCCLLTNTNKMIRRYSGIDGLKTGWTRSAGYGVVATSARDDTRWIAVVMGHEHPDRRFEEAARLLGWAFSNFESVRVAAAGDVFRRLPVYEGTAREVALVAADEFGVLVRRGEADAIVHQVEIDGPVVAPVTRGEQLGVLRILQGDRELGRLPLVADRDVGRLGVPGLWWRLFSQVFPTGDRSRGR